MRNCIYNSTNCCTNCTKYNKYINYRLLHVSTFSMSPSTQLYTRKTHVNLPTQNTINITKFWLNKYNNRNIIIKQTVQLIKIILNQNYFNTTINTFKPQKAQLWVHPYPVPWQKFASSVEQSPS